LFITVTAGRGWPLADTVGRVVPTLFGGGTVNVPARVAGIRCIGAIVVAPRGDVGSVSHIKRICTTFWIQKRHMKCIWSHNIYFPFMVYSCVNIKYFRNFNILLFNALLTFDGTVWSIISSVGYVVVTHEVKVHLIGTGHHVARVNASSKSV